MKRATGTACVDAEAAALSTAVHPAAVLLCQGSVSRCRSSLSSGRPVLSLDNHACSVPRVRRVRTRRRRRCLPPRIRRQCCCVTAVCHGAAPPSVVAVLSCRLTTTHETCHGYGVCGRGGGGALYRRVSGGSVVVSRQCVAVPLLPQQRPSCPVAQQARFNIPRARRVRAQRRRRALLEATSCIGIAALCHSPAARAAATTTAYYRSQCVSTSNVTSGPRAVSRAAREPQAAPPAVDPAQRSGENATVGRSCFRVRKFVWWQTN
jgi:hypothetical protein